MSRWNVFFVTVGYTLPVLLLGVAYASAQYLNGPAASVTAGQFCAEVRGWVGMSRAGHTLRSVSCRGGGHHFTVSITID